MLHKHTDLFNRSVVDMSRISPNIARHHLPFDPKAKWVAQRRRSKSDDKVEAVAKAVEDLIKDDTFKNADNITRKKLTESGELCRLHRS